MKCVAVLVVLLSLVIPSYGDTTPPATQPAPELSFHLIEQVYNSMPKELWQTPNETAVVAAARDKWLAKNAVNISGNWRFEGTLDDIGPVKNFRHPTETYAVNVKCRPITIWGQLTSISVSVGLSITEAEAFKLHRGEDIIVSGHGTLRDWNPGPGAGVAPQSVTIHDGTITVKLPTATTQDVVNGNPTILAASQKLADNPPTTQQADLIDQAEAKKRGVPVEMVLLEKHVAALERENRELRGKILALTLIPRPSQPETQATAQSSTQPSGVDVITTLSKDLEAVYRPRPPHDATEVQIQNFEAKQKREVNELVKQAKIRLASTPVSLDVQEVSRLELGFKQVFRIDGRAGDFPVQLFTTETAAEKWTKGQQIRIILPPPVVFRMIYDPPSGKLYLNIVSGDQKEP